MTWTTKPRDDVFRATCRAAMAARASEHEAAPVIVVSDTTMLPLVVPPYRDGIIKLGRRRLAVLCETEDWTGEDWAHMLALAACAFLTGFAFVVILLS
jgi:hypothetical protein